MLYFAVKCVKCCEMLLLLCDLLLNMLFCCEFCCFNMMFCKFCCVNMLLFTFYFFAKIDEIAVLSVQISLSNSTFIRLEML